VPFLALVLFVQVMDILPIRDFIHNTTSRRTWHAELINALQPLIWQADAVYVQGPWDKRNEALYASSLLAAPQGVPLISVYSARPDDAHVVWEKAFWEALADEPKVAENVLLVFPANWFLCIPGKTFLHVGDWTLMLPNRAVTTLDSAIPRFTSKSGPRPDEIIAGCTAACALVIVIRDKAPTALPERLVIQMRRRGSRIGHLGLRDSYIGVFENGKLRYEDFGQRRLRHETTLLDKSVAIEGAGQGFGSLAAIRIEGIDHAPNRRGLNIVMLQSDKPPQVFSYDIPIERCQ
jgi:hypothetical protein